MNLLQVPLRRLRRNLELKSSVKIQIGMVLQARYLSKSNVWVPVRKM